MSETRLELQIVDNSEATITALGNLEEALKRVRTAVSGSFGLKKVANEISKLTDSVKKAHEAGVAEYMVKMARALEKLSQYSNFKMPSLKGFASAKRQMDGMKTDDLAQGAKQASTALIVLNNSLGTYIRSARGLPEVTMAISTHVRSLKGLPETTETALSPFVQSLKELPEAAETALSTYVRSLKGLPETIETALSPFVRSKIGLLEGMEDWKKSAIPVEGWVDDNSFKMEPVHFESADVRESGEAYREAGVEIEHYAESVNHASDSVRDGGFTEVQSQIEGTAEAAQTAGNTIANSVRMTADEYVNSMSKVDLLRMKLESLKSALNEGISSGTFDDAKIARYALEIQNLQEKIEKLDAASGKSKSGIESLSDAMKELFRSAGEARRPFSHLMSQFARIAKYRFLRTVVKEIAEGFKFGFENMYQYAKLVGNSFAPAVDSATNALFKMKNSLGAALAPAFQMIIPYVVQLVQWFINLVNIVNQFLALLRGQSTWTKATDAPASTLDKVKKKADSASSSVKELKGLLADWDELNIIQQETGGGGGSGSGGIAADEAAQYGLLYEEVSIFNDKIKAVVEWLKDHMNELLSIAKLVGAALLGWKLHNAFTSKIGRVLATILGIALAVYGAVDAYNALKDQFDNGINWENFKQLIDDTAIAVGGLTMAFGLKGLGWGLAGFGLAGIASSLSDIAKNGKASKEALAQLKVSLLEAGIGGSILTGSWVFAVAGALGAAAIEIYQNKEKIVGFIKDHVTEIAQIMQVAGEASIAVGAMLALSGVSIVGGIGLMAAGLGMKDVGQKLPDAISGDVEATFKNIASIVGKDLMAIGALLTISGLSIKAGILMMIAGGVATGYGEGEGTDLLSYLTTAWKNVKGELTPLSLGMFAVGAVMAISGIGITAGLRMMALGSIGIGVGIATGTLLDDIKTTWEEISEWALPASLGLFAVGAILALSGVGLKLGLGLMALGAAGLATEQFSSGDLLASLKETWKTVSEWALPASLGLFAVGLALALTGAALPLGLGMMALGAAGVAAEVATNDSLKATLEEAWNTIVEWSDVLAVASIALGAILLLTGANIPLGLAMVLAGMAKPDGINPENLQTKLSEVWGGISTWWNTTVQPKIDVAVEWVKTNVINKVINFFVNLHMKVRTIMDLVKSFFVRIWEDKIYPKVEWINENIITPISGYFSQLGNSIETFMDDPIGAIQIAWQALTTWFHDSITVPLANFFIRAMNNMISSINAVIKAINRISIDLPNGTHIGFNISEIGYIEELKTMEEQAKATEKALEGVENRADVLSKGRKRTESRNKHLEGQSVPVFSGTEIVVNNIMDEYAEAFQQYDFSQSWANNPDILSGIFEFNRDTLGDTAEQFVKDIFMDIVSEVGDFPKEFLENMNIADVFSMFSEETQKQIKDVLKKAFGDDEEMKQTLESLGIELPEPDTETFTTGFDETAQNVHDNVEKIRGWVKGLDGLSFKFNGDAMGGSFNISLPPMPVFAAANGGMFTAGEMFIAREAGPEMVGRIGNRTGVANNNQIVDGITTGVASGQAEQNALLRQQNEYLRQMLAKESTVRVQPSTAWGEFNRKSSEMYARATGRG